MTQEKMISPGLLQKFDVPGPRYTSYPTADRFVETFTDAIYSGALRKRRSGHASAAPLSLYVHLPFCASLCYYCGCNKIVTRHHEQASTYLRYLEKELDLLVAQAGAGQVVTQLHLGGGTPTFLSNDELRELMAILRRGFVLAPGGEYSIEIDPRTVDGDRLAAIAEMGFNRLSFGVQDFDPDVQRAVNRVQPFEQVAGLMDEARRLRFPSINIDLIYGLPRQTPASFERTLSQVQRIRPDRIALYGYAHLPTRFKPQRRILQTDLPGGVAKVAMLSQSMAALLSAGYIHVGMDHFALPNDSLAVAKRQGRLHRNFQGYSTEPDCDLIALGVSAIGRVGTTYSQNFKTMREYCDRLDAGRLPIARGLVLSHDDQVRRAAIMALMCQGRLGYDAMGSDWKIDFPSYFAPEIERLQEFAEQEQELVVLDDEGIRVTANGWFVVRAVAMVFDRYLQAGHDLQKFSRII